MTDKVHLLTDLQRQTLRHVGLGYESKEIARREKVSHHAVDKRIERAVRILDAKDRREAARMLMAHETLTYERPAYEAPDLASAALPSIIVVPDSAEAPDGSWLWQSLLRGKKLTKAQRLFWALIGLPVIIMLTWGIFLAGVGALDNLKY